MTKKPFVVFNTLWDTYYPDDCQVDYEKYTQVVLNGESPLYDKWRNQYHISQKDFLYGLKWICYDLRHLSPTGLQTALAVEYDKYTDTYRMRPLTYDYNEFGLAVYTNATNNITKYDTNSSKVVDLIHDPGEIYFDDDKFSWLDNQQAAN